ncbi:MAG: cytidylyltransferase family protein [Desulfurococcales archaeon]|nr:cytidylyltransferase family protein [Desulfurococcales archaeon]
MEESACRRARDYGHRLRYVVASLEGTLPSGAGRLLDAVKRYLSDSEYFLARGDCESALVAVSYAEGLLDSLDYLGVARIPWDSKPPKSERKVLVAGTFDIIHPGHIELLRFASSLGKVYVIVSRDANAMRSKGRPPVLGEEARLHVISSIRYVYKALLGDPEDILRPLESVKPDIIVLGPDQPFDEEALASRIEERLGYKPKVIRFSSKRPFNGGMRGSRDIIRKICRELCPNLE